jgi:hypothetical protein
MSDRPNATHPAGAITRTADGVLRQHGDPNPELNESPRDEGTNLQAGDLDAQALAERQAQVTQPATDVQADRPDTGTE